MGSEKCRERELRNDESNNWEWPVMRSLTREEKSKLMGAAMEIAVILFFKNFAYTFGGKIFVQKSGGSIGATLMMCVARLVMQQWRDEFNELLQRSNIKEKMSKMYVDDNRCIIERIRKGCRFDRDQSKSEFKEE